MIKTYNIKVDGVSHIVEVEESNGVVGTSPIVSATANISSAPSINPSAPIPAPTPKPIAKAEGTITAPLQGVLQDIKVSVGEMVKSGQVIAIIEAMKMENEIVAPKDGKISTIYAVKGAKINSGDAILDIV